MGALKSPRVTVPRLAPAVCACLFHRWFRGGLNWRPRPRLACSGFYALFDRLTRAHSIACTRGDRQRGNRP